jgi:hypothetical protein
MYLRYASKVTDGVPAVASVLLQAFLLLLTFVLLLAFLLLLHRFHAVAGVTIINCPTGIPDVDDIPAVVGTPRVVGVSLLLLVPLPRAVVCIPAAFDVPPAVGFPAVFGSGVLAFSKTNMSGFECGTDNFFAAIGLSDNLLLELKKLTYSTKASNYRTIGYRI